MAGAAVVERLQIGGSGNVRISSSAVNTAVENASKALRTCFPLCAIPLAFRLPFWVYLCSLLRHQRILAAQNGRGANGSRELGSRDNPITYWMVIFRPRSEPEFERFKTRSTLVIGGAESYHWSAKWLLLEWFSSFILDRKASGLALTSRN